MNIIQITIFIILFILALYSLIKGTAPVKYEERYHWVMLLTLILSFSVISLFVVTYEMNNLREQIKNKCPEYEKLDDVYKLK